MSLEVDFRKGRGAPSTHPNAIRPLGGWTAKVTTLPTASGVELGSEHYTGHKSDFVRSISKICQTSLGKLMGKYIAKNPTQTSTVARFWKFKEFRTNRFKAKVVSEYEIIK